MARPIGSVGKHRHRAEIVFAEHDRDPLDELLKLAGDPALSAERRAQLWLALMPFLYPKLKSIVIEHREFRADDFFALPQETVDEIVRRCEQYARQAEDAAKRPSTKGLPLPTCRADLARYK